MSLPDDTLLTSLFNSGLILRQKEMHFFLKRFLQLYSSSCIDEFPKELFQVMENPPVLENILYDSASKVMFKTLYNYMFFWRLNHPFISERSTLTSILTQRFLVSSEVLPEETFTTEKSQLDILVFCFHRFCFAALISLQNVPDFSVFLHITTSLRVILPRSYTNFNIIPYKETRLRISQSIPNFCTFVLHV